jgi:hypothetical protein
MTANAASKRIDIRDEPFGKNIKQWPPEVGPFDYNAMNGMLGAYGSWYGPNNIVNMPAAWPTDVLEEECCLPNGHPAKASGIDVSRPFVLNGVTCGPLPGFEPGYFSGAAPDRGWIDRGEDGADIVAATFTVEPNSVAPGGDVEVSWTGGASVKDWYRLVKIGQPATDQYWAYTSSCSQSAGSVMKPSGTCLFTMPTELGNYEFQFLADNGYTVIATSNQIAVAEPEPPEPEEETMLVYVPALLKGGELVPVEDSEVLKRLMQGKKK